MQQQLALDLSLKASHTFDNFIVGDNQLLVDLLRNIAQLNGERQLFVWGADFTGKTHLLQAVCHQAAAQGITTVYISLAEMINQPVDILDGMSQLSLLCVDDVDCIARRDDWQEKLFDLINQVREAGGYLLFSASLPPNELDLQLEDLRSRLNWGPVLRLQTLSDDHKIVALQQRATAKGFELPDNVANYMINTYARDLAGLFERLDKLDRVSLEKQRKLTIPFVKEVFG